MPAKNPATIPATLIPGDGIGPEIMDAALAALDALGVPFQWDRQVAGLFEAVHGSAPDIAGKGIANPTALLLAAALMLEHCKLPELARRLRTAIGETLNADRVRTGDLGGNATTTQFTRALIKRIENAPNHID
jgi:isocitrate/isopropylmalate dehydrogenase